MNPAIRKLAKFLRLEADRGYDNRAVMGGLQKMLQPWKKDALAADTPEEIIEVVVSRLRDYPKLSPHSRKETLQGIWNRLTSEYPDISSEVGVPHPTPVSPSKPTQRPEEQVAEQPAAADTADKESEAAVRKAPRKEESSPFKPKAAAEKSVALDAPLTTLHGVGNKTAKTLQKLGLESLNDLLWHLPRRYDDYSQLKTINQLQYDEQVTIIGTVDSIHVREVRRGKMKLAEATIGDGTGTLKVTWFNQPWIANRLKPGKAVVLSGKIDQYLGHLTLNSPEWEPLSQKQLHTNRIVPVYPLTAGISGKWIRRIIHSLVSRYAARVSDPLPESIRKSATLIPLGEALEQIHFPENWDHLRQAQDRLAFDEMFLLQLGVLGQKREWESLQTDPMKVPEEQMDRFLENLPFELTKAQEKSIQAIIQDLASGRPMNRLLQGDVGSGKTVVAAAAIMAAMVNDAQSALMAPTSILAEQHYLTLQKLLPGGAGVSTDSIRLLLGATPESEKHEIRQGLEEGSIKLVIGTHALLEDPISFSRLQLAVIDEQHRFGVNQRATLRSKGKNPNLLVMTATPIPRSLALTIYGDLDLSIIDEMPPGRQAIETRVLTPLERNRAYQFIKSQIAKGEQAFLIYPLVEESQKIKAKAAVEDYERLQEEVFHDTRIGLLHGRMKPDEKEEVMKGFRDHEFDVLLSTSVVEVGVDVPNATIVLIEGANRFGLSQLHQFRGRVGRRDQKSFCLLIPEQDDEKDNQRLQAMESTQDGFELAEMDLNQRGPGDFLGTRQSGFSELHMAEITDIKLIEKARHEARQLFDTDPDLSQPEHERLAEVMNRFWSHERGEIS